MSSHLIEKEDGLYLKASIFEKCDVNNLLGPIIQEPKKLRQYLATFDIIGATIQDISYIAVTENSELCFMSTNEWGLEHLYEPIVIVTDKGSFQINFSESSSVIFRKDNLDSTYYYREITAGTRELFSPLRGTVIEDVIVTEWSFEEALYGFTGSWGLDLDKEQESFIDSLHFKLSTGNILSIYNIWDDGAISVLTEDGKHIALPGWYDPHGDRETVYSKNTDEDPIIIPPRGLFIITDTKDAISVPEWYKSYTIRANDRDSV